MNPEEFFVTPGNSPESVILPKIDFTEEGKNSQDSLCSWGKQIMNSYIEPIHEIIDNMSDISEASDRTPSPILSDLPKCKYCTCPEDKTMCKCMSCNKPTKTDVVIVPPMELTDIDSDISTQVSSRKRKAEDDEVGSGHVNDISNYLLYEAMKREEKRGTKFIFDVDQFFSEWDIKNLKIGIIKSKYISNFRARIFDKNIFKLTGRHLVEKYEHSLTHVVVDKANTYESVENIIFKWSGLTHPFPFKIVNEEWLIEFARIKTMPDETNYLFHPTDKDEDVDDDQSENDDINSMSSDEDEYNNEHIIIIFCELIEIYDNKLIDESNDKYKSQGYKAACIKLKEIPNITDVGSIPTSIWPENSKMWQHIKEIVETGKCEKLEYFRSHPSIISNRIFTKIHGIGPSRARDLVNAGFHTIADLRTPKGFESLSKIERISLSCYEDLQQRIPRDEVKEYAEIIGKTLTDAVDNVSVIAAGSYRRGASDCGDVDILIFIPDDYNDKNVISILHDHLGYHGANILVYDLTKVTGRDTNYMGICKLNKCASLYRRIDVKVYKLQHYAFALSAFTGNDHWNRSLRYFARKKGFSLSDKGLLVKTSESLEYLRSIGRIEQADESFLGAYVPNIFEERDIFVTLGIEENYKDPCQRNGSIFQK